MTKKKQVRVRFAPSPTGYLHIGNLRAGLFNWLYARHAAGQFLVRIEDTDRERSEKKYVDAVVDTLDWMGVNSDEPLVFQSQRQDLYQAVLQQLIEAGHAYRCFCTPEDIASRCAQGGSATGKVVDSDACLRTGPDVFAGYDRYCRNRHLAEHDLKKPFVIRYALPQGGQDIVFDDLIRGRLSVSLGQFDDFIIARSDKTPVYNFVVVVDDAYMGITHVIRGEDHITNSFKQVLLYRACGYQSPLFAHVPLVLGPSGDKLSKRDGATAVPEYRRMGFLPDALFNYLVRLGWAHGDQEVFSRQELVKFFSLDAVGKKGAMFDIEKLRWLNGVYIRQSSAQELFDRIVADVRPDFCERVPLWDYDITQQAIIAYKERVKTLVELADELILLHDGPCGPSAYEAVGVKKWTTPDTCKHLALIAKCLENSSGFALEPIQSMIKESAVQAGVKLVTFAQPLRLALLGKSMSPGIFELLVIVGKEESVRRIQAFCDFLKKGT